MKNIVVIGSLNMDLCFGLDHILKPGETKLAKSLNYYQGGKGANQACAIARQSGKVSMIGAVGADENGKKLKNGLKENGVDVEHVFELKELPSGMAIINIADDGENNIVVYPGANFGLLPKHIDECKQIIEQSDICVLQQEIPLETIYRVLDICEETNTKTVLNPAPANKSFDKKYFGKIDYIIPNETELEFLADKQFNGNVKELSDIVLSKGVKNIIVTLGERGSFYKGEQGSFYTNAKKVNSIDTTAAGDSFIGGFVSSLARGENVKNAIEYATKVSAITVTRKGAIPSIPTIEEVENYKFE